MLACARIGTAHSVVFSGFTAEALAGRIEDCRARVLITTDEGMWAQRPGTTRGVRQRIWSAAVTRMDCITKS